MKKKGLIISIILMVVLLGIWFLTRPETLGSMNQTYADATTGKSTVSFSGEAGDRIKFSFASNIENGELDLILYDSNGNQVYKLDRAKELEDFFTLENTDTYVLTAEYNNFIGNYQIKVFKAE